MKLNHLTDHSLLKDTLVLAQKEREILSQILSHLREIDRRKLYAELKCSSLYDYCVKVLKYSEGQAGRRVSASRLLREVPEIAPAIASGDLKLTQLNDARNFFNEEGITDPREKAKILEKIKGKTTKESERTLWDLRKTERPRTTTITIKEETHQELEKLRGFKRHRDLDELLNKMCEELRVKWDPTIVRRPRKTESQTRYVPKLVKAQVWERDGFKCSNCGTTRNLELDHIKPFGVGGKTTVENLRLLCWGCNQRQGFVFYQKACHSISDKRL